MSRQLSVNWCYSHTASTMIYAGRGLTGQKPEQLAVP